MRVKLISQDLPDALPILARDCPAKLLTGFAFEDELVAKA